MHGGEIQFEMSGHAEEWGSGTTDNMETHIQEEGRKGQAISNKMMLQDEL